MVYPAWNTERRPHTVGTFVWAKPRVNHAGMPLQRTNVNVVGHAGRGRHRYSGAVPIPGMWGT